MAFSDKAIGFFLQADSKLLTDELGKAEKSYDRFVGSLEKLNRKAFDSATGGLSNIAGLVKGIEKLTSGATQKVNLSLSQRSEKTFADAIEKAVLAAMMRVKLRMRASMPKGRLKMFSQVGSLRSQFRQEVQPPDFLGSFMKFAEGGVVPGKGKKDSVLSALTPGEVVLPTGLVKSLTQFVGTLQSAEGSKNILQTGLGTPKDQEKHVTNMEALSKALGEIVQEGRDLSAQQKGQLSKVLTEVDTRMKKLEKSTEAASEELQELQVIGGTGRFVGMMTAIQAAQQGLQGLAGTGQQAFQVAGGEGVTSFIDNLRELRVKIGLTGDKYGEFASKLTASSAEANVSLTQSTAAADALFDAGVRGLDSIANQSIVVAQAAKLTRADLGTLASTSFLLTDKLKFQADTLSALYGDTVALSRNLAVDAPGLVKNIDQITSSTKTLLQDIGPDAAAGVLQTFQRISAASSDIWADQGDQLNMVFAQALSGSDQALKQLNFLTDGIISTPEELVKRLEKGDVAGLFEGISERLGGLDQRALQVTAEALQLDPNLLKVMSKNTADFEKSLAKTAKLVTPIDQVGGAVERMAQQIDEVTTGTEKLQKGFQEIIGSQPMFIDLIEFLDQIPLGASLATFWIGKSLFGAVGKLARGMGKLLPVLGVGGAAASGAAGAAGAAGVAGAAAGKGGLLGKLAGVAGFAGRGALSVGKFAFSFAKANPLILAATAALALLNIEGEEVNDNFTQAMRSQRLSTKRGGSISQRGGDTAAIETLKGRARSDVEQVRPATVTAGDITGIIAEASAAKADNQPILDELRENNRLLKQQIDMMMRQQQTAAAAGNRQPDPVRLIAPQTGSDSFTTGMSNFDQ